jgi:hypothetical protein
VEKIVKFNSQKEKERGLETLKRVGNWRVVKEEIFNKTITVYLRNTAPEYDPPKMKRFSDA